MNVVRKIDPIEYNKTYLLIEPVNT